MKKQKETESIKMTFSLEGIETIAFELKPFAGAENQANAVFNMEIAAQAIPDKKFVVIGLQVRLKSNDLKTDLAFAHNNFVYRIENFDELVTSEGEENHKVNDHLVHQLSSISISTMRGIMFQLFKGSHLHGMLLSIVYLDPPGTKQTASGELKLRPKKRD